MQHVQLLQQLRSLRVPGMVEALEQQLEQPATHNDLSFEQRLNLLIVSVGLTTPWKQYSWPIKCV